MKPHTSNFKNQIKVFGRELDSIIAYGNTELGKDQLNSVSPHYESSLMKSVMKQLDVDSNVEIPLETVINYQFGVKVGNEYEYINFGNYVVYEVEKQEDTRSYAITCYDKMLYAMKPYESLGVTYPITIREYLTALCTKIGLTFANENDIFVNYDKLIQNELYLDDEGNSLDYTYRDVFDELSQVVAGVICINDNDEVEIRYPKMNGTTNQVEGNSLYIEDAVKEGILYDGVNNITQTNNDLPFVIDLTYYNSKETIDEEYLKDINVTFGEKYGPVNSVVLSRSAESDNIYERDEQSITANGLCEIKIKDNQILNGNNRDEFLPGIFNQLNGFEYYINDYTSTGITYLELMDMYDVQIGENKYACIMLNDEVNVTQGLVENIHADKIEDSETDYKKADKTDRRINQTYLIVDKQNGIITGKVNQIDYDLTNLNRRLYNTEQGSEGDIVKLGTQITQKVDRVDFDVISSNVNEIMNEGAPLVKTTSVTINNEGLNVSTDTSKISTTMTNNSFEIKDRGNNKLAYFGYDETEGISKAEMNNLTVTNYFVAGVHRIEKYEENGEERTGFFYIGG